MLEKQQKYVEEKKRDITNHKEEPQLNSRADEWNPSAFDILFYKINQVSLKMKHS